MNDQQIMRKTVAEFTSFKAHLHAEGLDISKLAPEIVGSLFNRFSQMKHEERMAILTGQLIDAIELKK
tara:strand:+ start:329 stop:532 length:204 start_codon:yes stop_codon:yes gene_type:complete